MARLFVFDTSNFTEFPIGGQLTSIHNFLHYVADEHPARMKEIVLVGLTLNAAQTGRMQRVTLFGHKVKFFPVMTGESDYGRTTKSVRLQYVKGLLRHLGKLSVRRRDVCYINTPEAYLAIALRAPWARCLAFSHQNYFEMKDSFRFYRDKAWILKGFDLYVRVFLRRMKAVFVLNDACEAAYQACGAVTQRVKNSIVLPEDVTPGAESAHHLIYVGRLSANKRIDTMIAALRMLPQAYTLTIVGDGEERERLSVLAQGDDRVRFTGAVPPEEVRRFLWESDILLMNSVYEGLPMVILEAMSYALPVVTTDAGGIAEAVQFGLDAELTDGTAEGIAAAVERVEQSYASYAQAALDNARRFDYRRVNRTVYELLAQFWKETAS